MKKKRETWLSQMMHREVAMVLVCVMSILWWVDLSGSHSASDDASVAVMLVVISETGSVITPIPDEPETRLDQHGAYRYSREMTHSWIVRYLEKKFQPPEEPQHAAPIFPVPQRPRQRIQRRNPAQIRRIRRLREAERRALQRAPKLPSGTIELGSAPSFIDTRIAQVPQEIQEFRQVPIATKNGGKRIALQTMRLPFGSGTTLMASNLPPLSSEEEEACGLSACSGPVCLWRAASCDITSFTASISASAAFPTWSSLSGIGYGEPLIWLLILILLFLLLRLAIAAYTALQQEDAEEERRVGNGDKARHGEIESESGTKMYHVLVVKNRKE